MISHFEQGHEFELADEDEIVVFGEVFEKKADLLGQLAVKVHLLFRLLLKINQNSSD